MTYTSGLNISSEAWAFSLQLFSASSEWGD